MFVKGLVFKFVTVVFVFSSSLVQAALTDDFVTTWKTDNPGSSNDTSITIPINDFYSGFSYQVDWNGDGDFDDDDEDTLHTGNATYDYTIAGTYQIRIKGDFPAIQFGFSNDADKLLSVDQWGTNQWASMNSAFKSCDNLVINATDTPDLSMTTRMDGMFFNALNIGTGTGNWNWSTTTITNMRETFKGANSFNKDITSWDVSNVLFMDEMFSGATIFNQNIGVWTPNIVQQIDGMFSSASNFNQPIGSWNISNVTDLSIMFANAINFNQDLSGWTTDDVDDMRSMFLGATSFDQDISMWNTAMVEDMSAMFANTNFNQNISGWNVENVENMRAMFSGAEIFNQPIGIWNTDKVTNMASMFFEASAFNQNISSWNTSLVTDMSQMFYDADAFNQDISTDNVNGTWVTSQVEDMGSMFNRNDGFNQDISNWNTANVVDMSYMFNSASSFNQPIGNWNTSKVENMANIFASADDFNQPLNWNTAMVTNMSTMFAFMDDFDQDLGNLNVESVINFNNMLIGVTLSYENYDALLVGWNNQNLQPNEAFHGGNSRYCSQAAQDARLNMENSDNWNISDGGLCNQTPVITSPSSVDVDENTTTVLNLEATDLDSSSLDFDITGGADSKLFNVSSSNLLRFSSAPDFEANGSAAGNNTYFVEVTVEDNGDPVESATQLITINVQDVADTVGNQAPIIISNGGGNSAVVFVDENQVSATTVLANDPDGDDITYSISGGADSDKFSISGVTGILLFNSTPDFEANGSAAGNNAYFVEVTATDDGTPNESDMQSIIINVEDLPEFQLTDHFVSTWKTDNPGTTNSTSIEIKVANNGGSDYQVDWNNDGDFNDDDENIFHSGDLIYDFGIAGIYQIRIQGRFTGLRFNNSGDKDKLLSIDQWGTSSISFMEDAYWGASNLVVNAMDSPNLSLVDSLSNTFREATNLGNSTGNWNWDTATIENLSNTFKDASNFNQDITLWDTSNLRFLNGTFDGATLFNQDIGDWNTALVVNMPRLFMNAINFNQDISRWNMGNVTSLEDTLEGAALSTENYDKLLIGWDLQDLLSQVNFDAGNSKYCSQTAQDARENMEEFDDWRFNDGGLTNSCLQTIDLAVTIEDLIETVESSETITYTVTVRNIANGDATASSIIDMLPSEIIATDWTCNPAADSSCSASGTGNINDTVDIASGSNIVYTVNATITSNNFTDVIYSVNAQASLEQTDLDPSNNTATDTNTHEDIVFVNGFD